MSRRPYKNASEMSAFLSITFGVLPFSKWERKRCKRHREASFPKMFYQRKKTKPVSPKAAQPSPVRSRKREMFCCKSTGGWPISSSSHASSPCKMSPRRNSFTLFCQKVSDDNLLKLSAERVRLVGEERSVHPQQPRTVERFRLGRTMTRPWKVDAGPVS